MKANTHAFNVDLATKLGDVNEVLILQHFYFWHQNNINKKETIKENHPYPWTYNTIEEFCKIFPYMKKTKLNGAINRLVSKDLLITGNYNKYKFDKTKWYSLTEKALNLFENSVSYFKKSGSSNEKSESSNENTIPDSNTDSNTDNKKYKKVLDKLVQLYPKNRVNSTGPILKYLEKRTDEELKQIILAVPVYLNLAGDYVKNLRNYLEHDCWTEEWLQQETKTKQKNINTNNNFSGKY